MQKSQRGDRSRRVVGMGRESLAEGRRHSAQYSKIVEVYQIGKVKVKSGCLKACKTMSERPQGGGGGHRRARHNAEKPAQ